MARRRSAAAQGSGALAYLRSRGELGKKFGLDTIRALVAELGHPERAYPTLLVGGTNGKGSVVALLDAALRAGGLRVGRYTSPHLVRVHERIAVGGRLIPGRDLDIAIGAVRAAADRLLARGAISAHPTYFEALTAAAFVHFRRRNVDVAVLEVGLGGRLDATNVSQPLVSAIVSIDYDHEEFLGRTLPRIAREKAGVLRPRRFGVLGPMPDAARRAIRAAALRIGARPFDAFAGVTLRPRLERQRAGRLGRESPSAQQQRREPERWDVETPGRRYPGLRPLPGAHQLDNLVVALRLLEAARGSGLRFHLLRAVRGLSAARWPGRLQWVAGRPRLLFDGAHNPGGARALAAYLARVPPFVLLFGVMRDKDIRAMAETLFPLARQVVLTRPPSPRSASPDEIAERAGAVAKGALREADPARALRLARRLAGPRGTVVVAGSLYLVGALLRFKDALKTH